MQQTVKKVAPTGVKRSRDVTSNSVFKDIIFGHDGLAMFLAMIQRNPIIMYPPNDAVEQRELFLATQHDREEDHKNDGEFTDVDKFFESRRNAEVRQEMEKMGSNQQPQHKETFQDVLKRVLAIQHPKGGAQMSSKRGASSISVNHAAASVSANYHHQQLDAFVATLFEFNHTSFLRLQLKDTLQLLARCGTEAKTHILELERVQRGAREEAVERYHVSHTIEGEMESLAAAAEADRLGEAVIMEEERSKTVGTWDDAEVEETSEGRITNTNNNNGVGLAEMFIEFE